MRQQVTLKLPLTGLNLETLTHRSGTVDGDIIPISGRGWDADAKHIRSRECPGVSHHLELRFLTSPSSGASWLCVSGHTGSPGQASCLVRNLEEGQHQEQEEQRCFQLPSPHLSSQGFSASHRRSQGPLNLQSLEQEPQDTARYIGRISADLLGSEPTQDGHQRPWLASTR